MTLQSTTDTLGSPHRPVASSTRASPKPRGRPGDTITYHNGIKYTKGWMSMRKITFRRSVYRSTGCKALLHLYSAGGRTVTGDHACVPTQSEVAHIINVTTSMKEVVDTLCIMDLSKPVHAIWKVVKAKLLPEDGAIRKGLMEEQFHLSRPSTDPTAKPQQIIGWAHPELRQLLMYHGVSIFVDGTFRCVPINFKQCIIVMAHDRASELFVPVYFVLCTGKTKDMYFDIMELIFRDTSKKLEPGNVVCDFKMALLDAVQKQFEKATIVGCFFHWKQAMRRRMKKILRIPEAEIKVAMTRGVLDMLTNVDTGNKVNANTRRRGKRGKGKNKHSKNQNQPDEQDGTDELGPPEPVNLLDVEGLSDSDSEDEVLTPEELENDVSNESSDENDVEGNDSTADFSFEYLEEERNDHEDTTANNATEVVHEPVV